jgi:hypothetical protein
MARIILDSYMVRYPLGGMMSWVIQYLVGFKQLGHDVYFVEKATHANACYDPIQMVMTDDCTSGLRTVSRVLKDLGLEGHWCFVDAAGRYHGLSRIEIQAIFKSADLFVDIGPHGAWLEEATAAALRVLVDGEPGFTQMKWEDQLSSGQQQLHYDYYYSTGRNIGTDKSMAPTTGIQWRPLFHPVVIDLFDDVPADPSAPFTTVMNWQSHAPIEFNGSTYGQKDLEFIKFMDLPTRVGTPLEISLSRCPKEMMERFSGLGWRIRRGQDVTISLDTFHDYIRASQGEFSVCKNVFVATHSGWFSDRSAAYLASGRPVVMQETGFSDHLPCGRGLFAVLRVDEAAAAIESIRGDYERHSKWAREIAAEYLDAQQVLGRFLCGLGL